MQDVLVGLLVVAGLVALLIAARLWRAKRLSDQAMTNLVIAWVPSLLFVYGVIKGHSPPFIVAITALSIAPGILLRRVISDIIRKQGELHR